MSWRRSTHAEHGTCVLDSRYWGAVTLSSTKPKGGTQLGICQKRPCTLFKNLCFLLFPSAPPSRRARFIKTHLNKSNWHSAHIHRQFRLWHAHTHRHTPSTGHWGREQTLRGASPSARCTWGRSPTEWWSCSLWHRRMKEERDKTAKGRKDRFKRAGGAAIKHMWAMPWGEHDDAHAERMIDRWGGWRWVTWKKGGKLWGGSFSVIRISPQTQPLWPGWDEVMN